MAALSHPTLPERYSTAVRYSACIGLVCKNPSGHCGSIFIPGLGQSIELAGQDEHGPQDVHRQVTEQVEKIRC